MRDGVLHQITRRERPPRGGKDWSSAHIMTRTFRQAYGYFEARIRYGRYLNNAFWLWRPGGRNPKPHFEIDINEGHTPREVAMTLHLYAYYEGDATGDLCSTSRRWEAPVDLDRDFHVYGLEWDKSEVVWHFDGQPVRRLKNPVCHAPVDIRLSTVVMTRALERDGVALDAMEDVSMAIDWVRAYRKTRDLYQPERLDLEVYAPPRVVAGKPRIDLASKQVLLHTQAFEEAAVGSLPAFWETGDGTPRVTPVPSSPPNAQSHLGGKVLELTPGAYVFRLFERPVTGRFLVEFDYCSPLTGDGLLFVTLGVFDKASPDPRRNSYYTGDIGPYIHWSRRFIRYYTETEKWTCLARRRDEGWQRARIVLDISHSLFDVYGGPEVRAFRGSGPFRHRQRTANGIGLRHRGATGVVYIDSVTVRTLGE